MSLPDEQSFPDGFNPEDAEGFNFGPSFSDNDDDDADADANLNVDISIVPSNDNQQTLGQLIEETENMAPFQMFAPPHASSRTPLWIPATTKGFVNEGNSCYLNSALQCLIHCPPFAAIFSTHKGEHRATSGNENPNLDCVFCLLEVLTTKMLQNAGSQVELRNYTIRIHNKTPQIFDMQGFEKAGQQDGSEFLNKLLTVLGTIEKEKKCGEFNKSPISNLLYTSIFQTCSYSMTRITTCTTCSHASIQSESDFILTLSTTRGSSLERVLEAEAQDQRIEEFVCETGCSITGVGAANRRSSMTTVPNVLMIQLQRTGFATGGRGGNEEQFRCTFGQTLDISPILENPEHIDHGELTLFELTGVMVFEPLRTPGTRSYNWDDFSSGHYISYVKSSGNRWTKKNDNRCSIVEVSEVLNQDAFLLFYVRHGSYARPQPPGRQDTRLENPRSQRFLVSNSEHDDVSQQTSESRAPPRRFDAPSGNVPPRSNNTQQPLGSTAAGRQTRLNQPEMGGESSNQGARSARFYRLKVPVASGRIYFKGSTRLSEVPSHTQLVAIIELLIPDPAPRGGQAREEETNPETMQTRSRSRRANPTRRQNDGGGDSTHGHNVNGNDGVSGAQDWELHPSISIQIREVRPSQARGAGQGDQWEDVSGSEHAHPSFTVRLREKTEPSART